MRNNIETPPMQHNLKKTKKRSNTNINNGKEKILVGV